MARHGQPRQTLRRRLWSLLLQWFVLYLVVAVGVSVFAFQRARRDAIHERQLLARTIARYLDSSISGVHRNLTGLAVQLPELDASAVPRLRSYRFQCLFRDAIFILDGDGDVVVADPPYAEPPPGEWLDGRPRVTPLVPSRGEAATPQLSVIQPFHRDGRLYYLAGEMRPLGSAISAFLQDLALGDDFHVAVVDSAGTVIAAADQKRLFNRLPPDPELERHIREEQTRVWTTPRCVLCEDHPKDSFLSVLVPLRHAPWGVLVQQQESRAFASLVSVQAGVVGTGLLLALMALFLFRALSRSVIAPIGTLSSQAEELRRGNLEAPITVVGDREIEVLADTLEAARRRLGSTLAELTGLNETLEAQVAERTRALRLRDVQRRNLVHRLMSAAEEERRRIARELHDEISQLLTVIQLSLDRVKQGGHDPEMEKAKNLLTKTQKEIHRVIFDLRPSLLDDLGLPAAVKWYARNYLAPTGLDVRLEVEEALEVPPTVEITAFRIYQEIVTNILRHARAETVSVELYTDGGRLVLAVEDDGQGFDPETRGPGAGIVGMRERAELVGGTLALDSEPGLGTHVQLEIPLESWQVEADAEVVDGGAVDGGAGGEETVP